MNKKQPGEMWPMAKLVQWEDNPRTITAGDKARLRAQIEKHGLYKPLIINQQGVILGGNQRFAVLKDMGVTEVWVSVVETNNDKEMFEIALSDNDRAGDYDQLKLAELVHLYPVDAKLYKVDLAKNIPLAQLPQLEGAALKLPNGEKSGFQQMTFTVSDAQAERVKEILEQIKDTHGFTGMANKNSNGNALATMAEGYAEWSNQL